MTLRRHARLFAALSCIVSCGTAESATPELKPQQFPGFSVDVPEGEVVKSSRLPFAGRHEVRLPQPEMLERLNPLDHTVPAPRVIVSWAQHDLDDGEHFQLLRGSLLKSLPGKNVQVLKESSTRADVNVLVIGEPGKPIALGTRRCERGFNVDVMVMVSTDVDEQFALARRITESIRCALTDANRRRPEAATRLPPGFVRVKREQFPTYVTLSGEQLVVNFTTGNVLGEPKAYGAVITGLLSEGLGVPVAQIQSEVVPVKSTPARQIGLLRVHIAGDSSYVGSVWCPKLGVTFLAFYASSMPAEVRARELLDSLGCPGEPSEEPPDAKPLFEASCADGDAEACATLEQLAF
jgi:hypothetical protein